MLSWIKMMRQNDAKRRMAELEERIRVLQNQNEWQKRTQASLFGQYEEAKRLLESYSERCATLYAENTMHRIRPAYNGSQALVDFFYGRETFRKGEPEPAQDDTAMSVLRSLGWRAAQYEDVTKRDVLDRLEPVADPKEEIHDNNNLSVKYDFLDWYNKGRASFRAGEPHPGEINGATTAAVTIFTCGWLEAAAVAAQAVVADTAAMKGALYTYEDAETAFRVGKANKQYDCPLPAPDGTANTHVVRIGYAMETPLVKSRAGWPQEGKSLDELHRHYTDGMQQRVENKKLPEEEGTLVAMLRNTGWRAADREIAIRKRTEEALQPNEVENSRRRVDPPHYPS